MCWLERLAGLSLESIGQRFLRHFFEAQDKVDTSMFEIDARFVCGLERTDFDAIVGAAAEPACEESTRIEFGADVLDADDVSCLEAFCNGGMAVPEADLEDVASAIGVVGIVNGTVCGQIPVIAAIEKHVIGVVGDIEIRSKRMGKDLDNFDNSVEKDIFDNIAEFEHGPR